MKRRVAVIGIPGRWSTEILADAIEARTGWRKIIDLSKAVLDFATGRVWSNEIDLSELDGVVVKKLGQDYSPHLLERVEMLFALERTNVRVFSPARSMGPLIDRAMGTSILRAGNVPMPSTILTEDVEAATKFVERSSEVVGKPLYSTKARGMRLFSNGPTLIAELATFQGAGNPVMYLQRKVELPGRDLGVVFLGDKYIATYARVKHHDAWSSSTASGGHYEPHTPSDDVLAVANLARSVCKLDFTCVDIVETPLGPQVFEVSAFGGFRGIVDACKIDIAGLYADYIMKEIESQ